MERQRRRRENEKLKEELDAARRASARQAAPFARDRRVVQPQRPGRKPGAAYGRRAHRPPPTHIDEHYTTPLPAPCPARASRAGGACRAGIRCRRRRRWAPRPCSWARSRRCSAPPISADSMPPPFSRRSSPRHHQPCRSLSDPSSQYTDPLNRDLPTPNSEFPTPMPTPKAAPPS